MGKEWVLNIATNRWGLNKKSVVGPVSQWIREVQPNDIYEWEEKNFEKLHEFLEEKVKKTKKQQLLTDPERYLEELGRKLYTKISEVMIKEIEDITLEDCIGYIKSLVINRTFDGFQREKQTVYSILEKELGVELKPAPDEMDRKFNVDFYIPIVDAEDKKIYVGVQIKPVTYEKFALDYNWKNWTENSHESFRKKYGGKVYVVLSVGKGGRKEILNREVIEELKSEIDALRSKSL